MTVQASTHQTLKHLMHAANVNAAPASANEDLQDIWALLPVGIVVLDKHGRVDDANPLAIELLGTPLIGEKWTQIIHRSFMPKADDGLEISLSSGKRIQLSTRALSNGNGQLIVLNDLTETRTMQARVAHKNRLAGIGQMMASLAHQLRTPITSALLSAYSMQKTAELENIGHKHAQRVVDRLRYMERQIADMLLVAGGGSPNLENLNVQECLNNLASQYEDALRTANIALSLSTNTETANVMANRDALMGAFSNLIENAMDALRNVSHREKRIDIAIQANKRVVKITIQDNGSGMSKALLAKVSDAFHTTKPKGTGLGLAVVRSVCEAHGAKFQLKSEEGIGSAVEMSFPVATNATVQSAPLTA